MKMPSPISLAFLCAVLLAGCSREETYRSASAKTGGDPYLGKSAIEYYGCASCHTVPGVPGADAMVGPSLAQVAQRAYLGGVLENTPTNLIRWLKNPPGIDAKTAMPDLHVTDLDAKNIASYLYTLR
jgi:cytochrome c